MSEQNILNATAASTTNPDYSIPIDEPEIAAMWQARSGRPFVRNLQTRGRVFQLHWEKADFTTYRTLRQWFNQYRKDFFSFFDIEDNRYYSGRFAEGSFKHEHAGNNQVNVSAIFVEIPGLAMFAYPSNWGVDSIIHGVRDGFGADLVKATGTWSVNFPNAIFKGGGGYWSVITNDTAEWIYFGYGFRYWAITEPSDGIAELSLDGTVIGTIDLYSAGVLASSVRFTQANVPLGLHRVKLRVTGTKNASSSGFACYADAIEVMR